MLSSDIEASFKSTFSLCHSLPGGENDGYLLVVLKEILALHYLLCTLLTLRYFSQSGNISTRQVGGQQTSFGGGVNIRQAEWIIGFTAL